MTSNKSTTQAKPGELNYALVDRYTAAHGAWGFLLAAGRIPLGYTIAFAVGWELLERPLKDAFPKLFPYRTQDSFQNAAGDALAMVAGWFVWKKLFEPQNRGESAQKNNLKAPTPLSQLGSGR